MMRPLVHSEAFDEDRYSILISMGFRCAGWIFRAPATKENSADPVSDVGLSVSQPGGGVHGRAGAAQRAFELANGGTVFLNEIDEMPVGRQAKLLAVLPQIALSWAGSQPVL